MRDPQPLCEIGRLKRRADFLRTAKGKRWHTGAMTVQVSPVQVSPIQVSPVAAGHDGVRIGFTLTRKVGNAVVRNRARRRLKEAVRLSPDLPVMAGHDYVIVGRAEAVRLPFGQLKRELEQAVRGANGGKRRNDTRAKNSRNDPPARDTRPERTRPEP